MNEFLQQHPVSFFVFTAIVLMLNGWFDAVAGFKPLAYFSWFLGGILGLIALSCGGIGEYCLFLGPFRWPLAAIVFIAGTYALWHSRPRNGNRR